MAARSLLRLFSIILAIALPLVSRAEAPVYRDQPTGEFMRSWLLLGPLPMQAPENALAHVGHWPGFERDFLHAIGGEAKADPAEGGAVEYDGGTAHWFHHNAGADAMDLDAAITKADGVLAYAYAVIDSPREQAAVLSLGSNDGVRVWLNGEVVFDFGGGRGLVPDDDKVPVLLRRGTNRLLLKIEEHGNKWGFACRLIPIQEALTQGDLRLFEVETGADGIPHFRTLVPTNVINRIFDKIELQAARRDVADWRFWTREWTRAESMPIDIPLSRFDHYLLFVKPAPRGGIAALQFEIPFTAGVYREHTLFENGKSDYSIVLADSASESETWAASELQRWLKEICGAELPIQNRRESVNDKQIVIGYDERAARIPGGSGQKPRPNDEAYWYLNDGPTLFIYGGSERGTMYGVFSFLERELGCRWYTPTVSVIPKRERFTFANLHHSEKPGVRVRNDFYFEAFEPIWAARNKVNGAMSYREQPGGVESYWGVHTFYPLVPPDEFFAEHPEYFSLIDGKRTTERAQLCLTNSDVLRIVTERLLKTIRENPQYLIYDVSQNDWYNPCQCDPCQTIVKREGSESGPVVWFVNQVAEAVEKEFPEKFVGTLAYQYTRKPPKFIKPRENVVIRLCSIEACFSHDFTSCPENAEFLDDLRNWARIAPHLYIWDYVVNFSHYVMPYPNFPVLQPNIQTFRDNRAIGIMEQAAYQSRGGEFAELRAYVIAKLLWDPFCDVDAVIDDFMFGYYGRSGQFVREYFDLLHAQVTPERHIHLGLKPDDPLFSDAFVYDAGKLFDRAEAVAENDDIRRRVELARLPLLYLKCKRRSAESMRDGTYARLVAISERERVTHFAESGAPHLTAFHAEMKAALASE